MPLPRKDEFLSLEFLISSISLLFLREEHKYHPQSLSSYDRAVQCRVKIITVDILSPYYNLANSFFSNAKIVLDRFHCSALRSHEL